MMAFAKEVSKLYEFLIRNFQKPFQDYSYNPKCNRDYCLIGLCH